MDLNGYRDKVFEESTDIAKTIHKKLYTEFRKHDIYPGQPELLFLIQCNDGIIQKELSSMNSTNESTIAIMLKKMELVGYIERRVNSKDKRALEVHITEKGNEVIQLCDKSVEKIKEQLFTGLSEEEYKFMLKIIKKIQTNIEK